MSAASIAGIACIAFVFATWLSCINRTTADRRRLLDWVFDDETYDYKARIAQADRVSYDRHLWRRLTFRDPWLAYSPEIQRAMKQ